MTNKTITVENLARVEGEAALRASVRGGRVERIEFNIFEPPRFFEAFLRGRAYGEVADITARICGICPVAYQMSAVHAMEAACGVDVTGPIADLRRLLYCGEWIESHTLHIYMLHAPDFLGYDSAIGMAQDHGDEVKRGLDLKKAGNEIVSFLGGREIHPINIRVGGFYKIPKRKDFAPLAERLKGARDAARETVHWAAALDFPDLERDYEFVALRHDTLYPFNRGRLVSSEGLDIQASAFEDEIEEIHVPHSTALHAQIRGRGAYLVGPLARYNLNHDRLSPLVRETAKEVGFGTICRNPYKSIIVRSLEVLYACDEALRLIEKYEMPDAPAVEVPPIAGTGHAITEAPRGALYHRYEIADDGSILDARIIPPTSQNQDSIEDDLRTVLEANLDMDDGPLQHRCEQTIRNYDPCISCATHFLKFDLDRGA